MLRAFDHFSDSSSQGISAASWHNYTYATALTSHSRGASRGVVGENEAIQVPTLLCRRRYRSNVEENTVKHDYGLILRFPNPFHPRRDTTVLIFAGNHTQGTEAAVNWFTESLITDLSPMKIDQLMNQGDRWVSRQRAKRDSRGIRCAERSRTCSGNRRVSQAVSHTR
jgi:hypothetical protein